MFKKSNVEVLYRPLFTKNGKTTFLFNFNNLGFWKPLLCKVSEKHNKKIEFLNTRDKFLTIEILEKHEVNIFFVFIKCGKLSHRRIKVLA